MQRDEPTAARKEIVLEARGEGLQRLPALREDALEVAQFLFPELFRRLCYLYLLLRCDGVRYKYTVGQKHPQLSRSLAGVTFALLMLETPSKIRGETWKTDEL